MREIHNPGGCSSSKANGYRKASAGAEKTSFSDISLLCASLHPFGKMNQIEPLLLGRIHTCRQNELLSPCFKTGSCFTRRSAREQTKGNTRTSGCVPTHKGRKHRAFSSAFLTLAAHLLRSDNQTGWPISQASKERFPSVSWPIGGVSLGLTVPLDLGRRPPQPCKLRWIVPSATL